MPSGEGEAGRRNQESRNNGRKGNTTMPGCWARNGWNCCSRLPQHGPDSIHSWLVAGACALSSFFALAGWRSAGFLFIAILETFQVNRTEGSWPIVLMTALGYLAGFITGPLVHRFNARLVIIAGTAISSAGLLLSFFATTIGFMTFTLGVIHAIGTGVVFIVAPTVISEHFIKNEGLAMGLNFAGGTVGLFVFPKLLEYLTAAYGLRGALLIFGAVTMNGLAFSQFTRAPSKRKAAPDENEIAAQLPPKATGDEGANKRRHACTVLKSPVFYLIMYSFNAYCVCYEFYMSLFVDFASDRGVAVSTAVTVMAAGAVSEVLGRLTLPSAVDRGLMTNQDGPHDHIGCGGGDVPSVAFLTHPRTHLRRGRWHRLQHRHGNGSFSGDPGVLLRT
ncbi:monocarboxylate transporter 9-like [Dermacentor silvarum]|uniref:monocarboxylate transporter 9-like n=1 Tax=Dermacentor silvarum TaxID=543639 RepID=UPI0021013A78|nr:monocarboxylate transporter 9-like [Dermacentor silvarum]